MIRRLRGHVLEKELTWVVVDVRGVGYGVSVSVQTSATLPEPDAEVDLYVHTHVYDGGIDLYGFRTPEDREVFLCLIGVSKVGHRTALNILSGMDAEDLLRVIAEGDLARLVRIPGIGKKTAERMVLELKDKFAALRRSRQAAAGPELPAEGPPPSLEDVRSALLNFGWKAGSVNRVIPMLQKNADEGAPLADLIREGLRLLQKQ